MLSLLGALLGFGTSFLPKVMDFFQDRQDKKHELAIMDKQIEAQKSIAIQQLQAVEVDADIREIESLHRHDVTVGVKWIDALRGSVRPVITYSFFALFVFVEVSAYLALTAMGTGTVVALEVVWDQDTKALFAAVMAFWFGQRSLRYFSGRSGQ